MIELNGMEVAFEHYPDGESRCKIPEELLKDGDDGYEGWNILMRYQNDEDLIHLMLLVSMLPTDRPRYLHLSHVPYARMDRAHKGESHFSLQEICRFINWIGFHAVMARDPHSDVCLALLDNCFEVSCMDALLNQVWLDSGLSPDSTVLVFPDAGAQKKYERFIGKDTAYVVGFKHRNFADGTIESLELLTPGTVDVGEAVNALVIDDLCSYGGTFILTAQTLREKWGFDNVYLAVTHCEPVARDGKLRDFVDHVYTTDSMVDESIPIGREFITRYPQQDLLGRIA